MRMPMHLNFSGHWNIVSGKNCVLERGGQIKRFADRILIVTGKSSAKKSGALDDFETLFRREGIEYAIFEGIEENPHYDTCLRATELCLSFGANGVLGIGGGSVIDVAKLFALKNILPVADLFDGKIEPVKDKRLIIVPTTCGTGSEMTNLSLLSLQTRSWICSFWTACPTTSLPQVRWTRSSMRWKPVSRPGQMTSH